MRRSLVISATVRMASNKSYQKVSLLKRQMLDFEQIQRQQQQQISSDRETRDSNKSWHYSHRSPYRRNVLDLLELFGKKALTSHIVADVNMKWVNHILRCYESSGQRVTVTAILIKAISVAQKSHPAGRTFPLPGSRTVTYNDVVAGFTVERMVDGEAIVFFGEIEQSQEKSLPELALALESYARGDIMSLPKLRQQMLFSRMPGLLRRAVLIVASWIPCLRQMCMKSTFGLSNLGALGASACFGPSVCTSVFGVGAITDRVMARDGAIHIEPAMTLALSFDQRVMDAGQAALFLRDVKGLMEGVLGDYIDVPV